VVYAVKSLLRSEGARDYIDMLRSMKHRPNLSIIDIAHVLASHGNKTIPGFFSPDSGRLAPVTTENIARARSGQSFDKPCLRGVTSTQSDPTCHPITGSADHYCLI
jgi:hypothetical protein